MSDSAIRNPKSAITLRITSPTKVLINRKVTYVQAEDPRGRFGILPGHEPYLTTIVPSVLIYRFVENRREEESYAAVRHGVLRVTREGVQVAVRGAYLGDELEELQEKIHRAREVNEDRSYRSTRSLYQMQIAAWRRLMEFEHVPAE